MTLCAAPCPDPFFVYGCDMEVGHTDDHLAVRSGRHHRWANSASNRSMEQPQSTHRENE